MVPAQVTVYDLEAVETRDGAVRRTCANGSVRKDLAAQTGGQPHGPWHLANSPALKIALPNAYFDSLGLPELTAHG